MIQLLENYGLIYFTRDKENLEVFNLNQLSKKNQQMITNKLKKNKNFYLTHALVLIVEDKEAEGVILFDPDTRESKLQFNPPLEGPKIDPDRWEKALKFEGYFWKYLGK